MAAEGDQAPHSSVPKALAFYLPQYHPIPENDEWWGKGFTEWVNVTKARPLFPGHYQPHVPGELGYYDLRVPEVREAQAQLAADHGIHGFVYYHYWFNGRRLLERPFQEVLDSGSPDFPFALCWANEEWTRNWDARSGSVLMPQEYSADDDLAHIRFLSTAFRDDRYITIDGRPMMLVYRPERLPDPKRTFRIWRDEAKTLGIPDLYLCYVESHGPPRGGPESFGMDASVGFMPAHNDKHRVFPTAVGARGHRIVDYAKAVNGQMRRQRPPYKRFPSVMVGWDNTARRQFGATIYEGASPEAYATWLRDTVESVADVATEENYVFLLAWNEWAEGNHLEPDLRFGRAWLEATRDVLAGTSGGGPAGSPHAALDGDAKAGSGGPVGDLVERYPHDSAMANAAGLVRDLIADRTSTVVELGADTGTVNYALEGIGVGYHGLPVESAGVDHLRQRGLDATQVDLTDADSLTSTLDVIEGEGPVGSLLLLDVLGTLLEPQNLLARLSTWALDHGEPVLVVSVPNVAHFDIGLRLLWGQWIPTEAGLLDSTQIRFFTDVTLNHLLERTGWELLAREDFSGIESDQFDRRLADSIPREMAGALRVLADTENPNAAVQQFVWAARPVPIAEPVRNYLEAVGLTDEERLEGSLAGAGPVCDYLDTVGILASEASRRSDGSTASKDPAGRQRLRSVRSFAYLSAYENPRIWNALQRVRGRLR